jgi:hypothetical protein
VIPNSIKSKTQPVGYPAIFWGTIKMVPSYPQFRYFARKCWKVNQNVFIPLVVAALSEGLLY